MLAPKYVEKNVNVVTDENCATKLQEQLDLSGAQSWTANQKYKIHEILEDFHDIFTLSPMELGCTSLVKHSIKIVDPKPFKE